MIPGQNLILWLVNLAFFAGVGWTILKAVKKDLAGLGTKVRGIQEANEQRYLTFVTIILLEGVAEEKRDKYERLAEKLLTAAKGRHL